jgi:hypothetical protein
MRWLAGLLLVLAAVLKAVQVWYDPSSSLTYPWGGLLLSIQIGTEFVIGFFVLSKVYWRGIRWVVISLFSAFAAYSLYLAANRAASCGCFGPIRISPWWSFSLDLTVVLGLLISASRLEPIAEAKFGHLAWCKFHRMAILVLITVAVLGTAFAIWSVGRRTWVGRDLLAIGSASILEPEEWVGKYLPIADFLDTDLSSGEWIAVLYRHDCPDCLEILPHYQQLALMNQRIALVEVPPYGDLTSAENGCHRCRLKNDRDWFVQTPVELRLRDGVVAAVKAYGR